MFKGGLTASERRFFVARLFWAGGHRRTDDAFGRRFPTQGKRAAGNGQRRGARGDGRAGRGCRKNDPETSAKAKYDHAEIELSRVQRLKARESITQSELDQANTDFKTAKADLVPAQRAVEEARIGLSLARCTSRQSWRTGDELPARRESPFQLLRISRFFWTSASASSRIAPQTKVQSFSINGSLMQ